MHVKHVFIALYCWFLPARMAVEYFSSSLKGFPIEMREHGIIYGKDKSTHTPMELCLGADLYFCGQFVARPTVTFQVYAPTDCVHTCGGMATLSSPGGLVTCQEGAPPLASTVIRLDVE